MKISVITPSFNSGRSIARAVNSVLEQGYDAFEHIIVDGASADGTLDVLKRFAHLRWFSEPDGGQSDAMNKGIAMATGEIVVVLNADDYFLPGAFRAVVPFFEKGALFVVGDAKVLSGGAEKIVHPQTDPGSMLRHWRPWRALGNGHFETPYPNNPVQYFYRRSVHNDLPFNAENHLTMDLEFLLEAASRYEMTKIDALLGVYVMSEETKTVQAVKNRAWDYWSVENFAFIDRFLSGWTPEAILQFKREQFSGYRRNIDQNRDIAAIMKQLAVINKTSAKRHPVQKLKGFVRLLQIFRAQKDDAAAEGS